MFMATNSRPSLDLPAIRAANPLPGVVAGAGVKLQRAGGEWKGCCPIHADRTPSFTIFKGGERFHCFGCGATGDVLDFIQALHGVGLVDAAEMLGGDVLPMVEMPKLMPLVTEDRTAEALAIWEAAEPATGTLAEHYLNSRGLHLPMPPCIRFAGLRYGRGGREYPCLIAAVSGPDGNLTGIQRTYLADHGEGKADVPKPKLSLGKITGGAIRLAEPDGELIVTEGLEDGLTLAQETHRSVWVACGTAFLPAIQFPPGVDRVAIGGDADDAGREAADIAATVYAIKGLTVRAFFPLDGFKDFNAELQGVHA